MDYFVDFFLPRLAKSAPNQVNLIEAVVAGYKICHPDKLDGTAGTSNRLCFHRPYNTSPPNKVFPSVGCNDGVNNNDADGVRTGLQNESVFTIVAESHQSFSRDLGRFVRPAMAETLSHTSNKKYNKCMT